MSGKVSGDKGETMAGDPKMTSSGHVVGCSFEESPTHLTATAVFPNAGSLVRTNSVVLTHRSRPLWSHLVTVIRDERHGLYINEPQLQELLPPVSSSGPLLFSLSPCFLIYRADPYPNSMETKAIHQV